MKLARPKICAVIARNDPVKVREIETVVDLFEVRIDLLGEVWPEVVRGIGIPWIATNRTAREGGEWSKDEGQRREELIKALSLGASFIDIELESPEIEAFVPLVKQKAGCIISYHNLTATPDASELEDIARREFLLGADIGKVVTRALCFEDNLKVLELISHFNHLVSFAMGEAGLLSRLLSPLVGAEFTYASLSENAASAPGQLTVEESLRFFQVLHAR